MTKKDITVDTPPAMELALLQPVERAAIALKSDQSALRLKKLAAASTDIVTVLDSAGRDQVHRAYMVLKNERVAIDHTKEIVTEDAKLFTKAVATKAGELVALISKEEDRLKKLRDDYDEKVKAAKEELERIERERVEKHKAGLAALRANVPAMVGKPYIEINQCMVDLSGELPTEEQWEEFTPRAIEVHAEVCDQLKSMASAQLDIEMEARLKAVQAQEEAKRVAAQAEINRLAQIELDRQRAEIAADQKRIADALQKQHIEAELEKAKRDRLEAEARAERERVDAAARAAEEKKIADKHAADMAKLKEEADKLAEERAAFQKKLDEQAAEDARRKQLLADEAEAARVAALPVERVVEILDTEPAPAPHMLTIVPTPPFEVPDDLGVTTEQVAEIVEVEAFRFAARALLAHQSAEDVMNLLDEVIDSMMCDAPDSVEL